MRSTIVALVVLCHTGMLFSRSAWEYAGLAISGCTSLASGAVALWHTAPYAQQQSFSPLLAHIGKSCVENRYFAQLPQLYFCLPLLGMSSTYFIALLCSKKNSPPPRDDSPQKPNVNAPPQPPTPPSKPIPHQPLPPPPVTGDGQSPIAPQRASLQNQPPSSPQKLQPKQEPEPKEQKAQAELKVHRQLISPAVYGQMQNLLPQNIHQWVRQCATIPFLPFPSLLSHADIHHLAHTYSDIDSPVAATVALVYAYHQAQGMLQDNATFFSQREIDLDNEKESAEALRQKIYARETLKELEKIYPNADAQEEAIKEFLVQRVREALRQRSKEAIHTEQELKRWKDQLIQHRGNPQPAQNKARDKQVAEINLACAHWRNFCSKNNRKKPMPGDFDTLIQQKVQPTGHSLSDADYEMLAKLAQQPQEQLESFGQQHLLHYPFQLIHLYVLAAAHQKHPQEFTQFAGMLTPKFKEYYDAVYKKIETVAHDVLAPKA